jgi:hypothetical protein
MVKRSIGSDLYYLLPLLIAAAVFRFWNYDDWSLTNDELSALTRLKFDSISEMLEKGVRTNDMHPMGVQSFLWVWTEIFGMEATWLRLPFVCMGVASVFLLYAVAKNFFGPFPALLATAVFSGLDFPVLYAQLARPYSPGLFFSLLFVYTWSNWIWYPERKKRLNQAVFILAGVGCMYIHYFSFLFAAIVGLSGLFMLQRTALKEYVFCGMTMFILYLPNLDVFLTQFGVGGLGGAEGWLGVPESDAIWQYVLYGFNSSVFLIVLLLVVGSVGFFANRKSISWNRRHTLAFLFFLLPALVAYFYSVFGNPVFQNSILLFSFPMLVMLIFSFFTPEINRPWQGLLAGALLVISFCTAVADGERYAQQFAPFKDVVQKCATYNRIYGSYKVDASVNVIHPNYVRYYSEGLQDFPPLRQYHCTTAQEFLALKKILEVSKGDVFIHAWANTYHAPEVEMIIQSSYPYLIQRDSFFNAGVLVYTRDSSIRRAALPMLLFQDFSDAETNKWQNDSLVRTSDVASSGVYSWIIKEGQEYSPGIKEKASRMGFTPGAVYKLSCKFRSDQDLKEVKGVVSVDRDGVNILWRGIALQPFAADSGWNTFYAGYKLQEAILPDDIVSVYFFNPAGEEFWLDDIRFVVEAR